jgi:hypothetical protein
MSRTRLRSRAAGLLLSLMILGLGCSERDSASSSSSPQSVAAKTDVVIGAASKQAASNAPDPARAKQLQIYTEQALADLERASAFLATQPRFAFRAVLAYDVLQEDGLLLELGGTRKILVRRPDRVRFEATDRSGATKTLYFDGTTLSVDLPEHGAYVSIERPGTLYSAVNHLVDDLGIPAPLEDLVGLDFSAKVRPRIESGYYVDTDVFDGRRCLQLAYRMPDIDVQFWLEEGERPLPCRIVITYRSEPGRPQFRAQLLDWDLAPEVPDATFQFTPAAGAERVPVTKRPRAAAQTEETS